MNPHTFSSPIPTAISESHGTISLVAWVAIGKEFVQCHIIEASAETQSARVRIPGRLDMIAPFRQIQNVSLRYSNGEVIQNFGSPRTGRPESLEYIQYAGAQS